MTTTATATTASPTPHRTGLPRVPRKPAATALLALRDDDRTRLAERGMMLLVMVSLLVAVFFTLGDRVASLADRASMQMHASYTARS